MTTLNSSKTTLGSKSAAQPPRPATWKPTILCAVLLAAPAALTAADRIWSGAGADAFWNTAANWGVSTPAAGDTLRFDGATGLANTNDIASDTAFAGLTFLPGASAFTLAGNRVKLDGNIVNQSPAAQTIGFPLVIDATADRAIDTANGPIRFDGSLNYPGTSRRYYIKRGTNELVFTGTSLNTTSNNCFSLEEGTLRFAPGSRFHLNDTSVSRDVFRIGNVANKKSALIVEQGADVAIGGLTLQMNGVSGGTGTFDLLVNGGTFDFTSADNTFGDQNGNRATLTVDHGGLITNSTPSGCLNLGTRSPASLVIEDGHVVLGQLSFGRSNITGDRKGGRSDVTIKNGSLTIRTKLHSNTTSDPARTNTVTLGDGRIGLAKLSTPNVARTDSNGRVIFNFNGGILECLNAHATDFLGSPNEANLLAGGVIIDTQGYSVTLPNTVLRDASLSLDVRDGGLTKRGSGSLTFNGAAVQFNGPLRVEDGSLRISAAMLADLEEITLAPGKTLSLRGSYGQNLAPQRLVLGDAATASRLDFDATADGTSCDSIHIPAGGYVGKLNIHLKQRGSSDIDFSLPGSYPVFTYATEPPNLALLTHANRTFGTVSSFSVDRAAKTVYLTLAASTADTTWANPLGGAWETADNWTPAIPNGTLASAARFWEVITAPATVTLATDTAIGDVSFKGANAYTLTGPGTLTVGNYLTADSGSHTVALPLNLSGTVRMDTSGSGQTLTVGGLVSGSGAITKAGVGALTLTNPVNTFSGGLSVSNGRLEIPAPGALGSGALTLSGGTTAFTSGTPLDFANPVAIRGSNTLDVGTSVLTWSGPLTWPGIGLLTRTGAGEWHIAGTVAANGADRQINFREGVTRILSGATVNLRGGNRDVLHTAYTASGQASSLIIESGATVNASGMRLLANGAAGVTTVHVAGGALNLLDTECTIINTSGGRANILVDNGGSLYAAKGWFSLGVNGLGTLAITNGSVAVGHIVAAGYGDTTGTGTRGGSAEISIGPGGRLEASTVFVWITDAQNKTATVRLAGGTLTLPPTVRSTGSIGTATLTLDGGTLDLPGLTDYTSVNLQAAPSLACYLFGVDAFQLGANGVTVDTHLNDITVTQPLVMEPGTPAGAAFVKTGAGSLTLAGANTFDAPVTVAAGTLTLPTLPNNAVTVADGATLATGAGAATSAAFGNGATLSVAPGATLAVSGALTLGAPVNIRLNGTVAPGTATLFTYGSLAGAPSALRIANPLPDFAYAFNDTGSAITLTVSANPSTPRWAVDDDGAWSDTANWNPQTAPDGAGHAAIFDLAFAAPRTVTLDAPVTLGSLAVDSAAAPVLAGNAALAFDNGTAAPALITVAQGAPVIQPPITLHRDTLVTLAAATSLTLAGPVSGAATLAVNGQGRLTLAGTNTAAQTVIRDGATLALASDEAQQAPVSIDGATLASAVSSVLSVPVTSGPLGASLTAASGQTLTLAGALAGEGHVIKTGSGTVALTGALAYQGATAVSGGTLALATPPPAALTLGAGTLAYTGAAPAAFPGYTLNTASNRLAAVLASAADITVTGQVSAAAGGFVKTGPGTLAFTYPGAQTLGVGVSAAQDTCLDIGPDGDAPTQGFTSFSIAEGTVTLGAENQINTLAGSLAVGRYTTDTAGAETAAHLVIAGGTLTSSGNLLVGRGNGNAVTAPEPLRSTATINGGTVNVAGISIGANGGNTSGYNARPAVTVNGGNVTAAQLNAGEHLGSDATFTLNNGTVTLSDTVLVGHQTGGGGGGTATLAINGGSLAVTNSINLGVTASATGTLHLAGGSVAAHNVTVGSGYGRILFDGGTLSLRTGPMDKPQELLVLAGGAHLDVQSGRFTLALPLRSGAANDAGLLKTGAGMLALDTAQSHTYTGPTVVQEGTLAIRGPTAVPIPSTTALTIAPDASFHTSSESGSATRTITVAGLTLGEASPAAPAGIAFWCGANDQCDQLVVNGSPILGQAAVSLYQIGSLDSAPTGTYPIIAYTGADPDVTGLSVANPIASRAYAFSVDSANRRVLVTVATGQDDTVWTADSDGLWSQGANWQNGTAPADIAPLPALFANVLSQDRAVTVDTPAKTGGLVFDATHRYTVAGPQTLTLAGGAPAMTLRRGSHTVAAPIAVDGAANVSLAPTGNALTLTGDVSGDGAALSLDTAGTVILSNNVVSTAFSINTGTLQLSADASVDGTLRYSGGIVLASGNAALNGIVELPPGDKIFRANNGMTLTANGAIIGQGNLVKENEGTLELAANNTYSGTTRASVGTLAFRGSGTPGKGNVIMSGGVLASAGTAPVAFDNAIGFTNTTTVRADAPLTTGGALAMPGPRTLVKEGTNMWTIAGALDAGGSYTYKTLLRDGTLRFAPGAFFRMAGAELEANPGDARQQFFVGNVNNRDMGVIIESNATVIAGSLGVHWDNASGIGSSFTLTQNGGSLTLLALQSLTFGDGSNMLIRVNSNGGELRQSQDAAWADIGTRSKVTWNVNGGHVSLGRAAFGRQNGSGSGRLGGGTTLTINDGTWEARDFFSWKSTDDNTATNTVTLGCGIPRQGRFGVPATRRYHNGGRVILTLDGGILALLGQPSADTGMHGSLFDCLYGVNELNVLKGGAVFETRPATNAMLITQTLLPGAEGDGGVTKLGAGTLTLTADVALTGRVTVVTGTLDAAFTAAPDLTLGTDGTLALSQSAGNARFTNVDGTGCATNGTLTVAGTLSPGDAAGEAGALRAQHLAFASGATYRYDWSATSNDLFAVSGQLTGAPGGFIDFGRELGDEIPVPFTAVIGTYGTFSGTFGGWKVRNAGYPANRAMSARITAGHGVVTLDVVNGGLLMILK